VLDLCTGTGLLARRVARRCPEARVLGVDFDRAMIAHAQRLHSHPGLDNLNFQVADVTCLPHGDSSVDCVTCALGLHEMPAPDVPRALAEAFRVLRPGGQLVVLDFNPRPVRWQSRAAMAVLRLVEEYLDGFSELDLTSEIRECGFAGVADLMPPGGLFQLLDCAKP
jgi:ubiquinone/menaquinone biosynthesis C-methylase UbiE